MYKLKQLLCPHPTAKQVLQWHGLRRAFWLCLLCHKETALAPELQETTGVFLKLQTNQFLQERMRGFNHGS